jgi:hypothetical protein
MMQKPHSEQKKNNQAGMAMADAIKHNETRQLSERWRRTSRLLTRKAECIGRICHTTKLSIV